MIQRLASLLICLILVSVISPAVGDHLTFRGDAQRTGNVSGTGHASSDLLWSEKLTAKDYILTSPCLGIGTESFGLRILFFQI